METSHYITYLIVICSLTIFVSNTELTHYCNATETLESALSDLLGEFNFVTSIYLVYDDIQCQSDFEGMLSKRGITFKVRVLSEFNNMDPKIIFSKSNLLIIYHSTNAVNLVQINETTLSYFINIILVSHTTSLSATKLHTQIDYKVLLLHKFKKNTVVLLTYQFGEERISGVWSTKTRWRFFTKVRNVRETLKGKVLKVATLPALQTNLRREVNGTIVYSGLYIDYLDLLANSLNFTYKIIEPGDGVYGSDFDGDGQWDGIIGMAQRREIDIGSAAFTQTVERRRVIDYLEYYTHSGLAMLMKRPDNSMTYDFLAAFKPFKPKVWIVCVSSICVSSIVLWLFLCSEHHITIRSSNEYFSLSLFGSCLRYFTGAAFAQGGDIPGNSSLLSRMFISIIWLTFIILQTMYVANLISFMAAPKIILPANTLKELAEQNSHKIGILKSSSHEILFRTATSGVFKQVWDKVQSYPGNLVTFEEGFSKVRKEKFIFIIEDAAISLLASSNCDLVRGQKTFLPRYLGWITPKDWPYAEIFNDKIIRLRESGILDMMFNRYALSHRPCPKDNSAVQLGLQSLKGVFTFLAVGCFSGFLVFIVEKRFICNRKIQNNYVLRRYGSEKKSGNKAE